MADDAHEVRRISVDVGASPHPERMTTKRACAVCLRKYREYEGRATRSEYWKFTGVAVAVFYAGLIATAFAGDVALIAFSIAWLVVFLPPLMTVGARRMHDVDRAGLWYVGIMAGPLAIPVLVLLCTGSGPDNQYGPRAERTAPTRDGDVFIR